MRIGIIGTAFRKEDAAKLTRELYDKAKEAVRNEISKLMQQHGNPETTLVSGGAAGADHITVDHYLDHNCNLELHFPSKFDKETKIFYGNGDADTANYYHRLFSQKTGFNSLDELASLYYEPLEQVSIHCYDGFLQRNLEVGKVDVLIALTFNNDTVPKKGGTRHTWNNSSAPLKIHIDLGSL